MRVLYPICVLSVVLLLAMAIGAGQGSSQRPAGAQSGQASSASARAANVSRGKYLAEEVAKCTECHTPRDADGQLEQNRWLQGAPIWIEPVRRFTNWADRAPALAGLRNYTDEQVERVLEQGIGVNGQDIQPPMHIYHLMPEDAQAIIAYLRSLQ